MLKRLLILLLPFMFVITPITANAAELSSGWYTVSPKKSALLRLSVDDVSNGTKLKLKNAANKAGQKFYFQKQTDGTYKLGTGTTVGMSAITSGETQQKYVSSDNKQRWNINSNADGSWQIVNASTNKALSYSSLTDGNLLSETTKSTVDTQKFLIKPFDESYTVTFVDGLGKTLKRQSVKKGKAATAPANPTRTGYTFAGWDKSLNNITASTNITAKWTPKIVKLIFHWNTSSSDITTYERETYTYGKANQSFGMLTSAKTGQFGTWKRDGYTLLGWSADKNATKATYNIYSNVSNDWINKNAGTVHLYAVWKANTGWESNNTIYRQNGVILKGLQKIGNKWYIFNKKTGEKEQEGSTIFLGSFFESQSDTKTRMYITLDGNNFRKIEAAGAAPTGSRDMSILPINGKFYGVVTGYANENSSNATKEKFNYEYFDFVVRNSSNLTSWGWHKSYGAYVNTDQGDRWAPEWFIDDNGKQHVFYTVKRKKTSTEGPEVMAVVYDTYRTMTTDIASYKFSTPVKMNFNPMPSRGFIDAFVIKKDKTYYMFVKNEYGRPVRGYNADGSVKWGAWNNPIWCYTSTDLTNWKKLYEISTDTLPTPTVYKEENGVSVGHKTYYEGPFVIKIGNTYHLYLDIMDWTTNLSSNILTYPSQFQHLTSTDLKTWTNKGIVNTYGEKIRHGSMVAVTDNASIKIIQDLYNK